MNSFAYNRHLIMRLRIKMAEKAEAQIPYSEVASSLGLSTQRLSIILGSENGFVCLRTRQRIQDFLGLTWAAANEGQIEMLPEIPRPWFVSFQKRLNRFRGFLYSLGRFLGVAR